MRFVFKNKFLIINKDIMLEDTNNKCHFCNIIFKRHYNLKIHLKEQRCKSNLLNDWYKLNMILNNKEILVTTYENQIKEQNKEDINDFKKNTNKKLTEEYKLVLKNEMINELKEKLKLEIDEKTIMEYKKEVEQNVKKNIKNKMLRKYKKSENGIVEETVTELKPIKRGRPKKQKVIDVLIESEKRETETEVKSESEVVNHITIKSDINNNMINPINKLNLKDNMENNRNLIIKYEKHKHNCSDDLLQSMLAEYIKNVIQNKNNPENHCIKYIKKKPPTYNIVILDQNNKKTCIIKKLHECPVILYEPICKIIKKQLRLLLYKSSSNDNDEDEEDEDNNMEYTNSTVHSLANQLVNHHGQKILMSSIKSVLHNNILFDKDMKFSL